MINFKKFEKQLPDSPEWLPDSLSRGVSDSPTRPVKESPTLRIAEFSFKHSKADSPTRRVRELSTPWLAKSESQQLPDSPSRQVRNSPTPRVVFWLWISPRIRSQNRNGSKGNVRDLWGTSFCKNPRKSASLPCPFKEPRNRYRGINSEESISPAHITWGAGTTSRVFGPARQAGKWFWAP
jgi:hypothetical protein